MMNNDYSPYEKLLELELGYLKIGQHQENMARQTNQNAQVLKNLTEQFHTMHEQFKLLLDMIKQQQEHIDYLEGEIHQLKG
jgi:uncharacterized protein HemX